jgi:predicted metal-dependent phosphoesterase TrpH
LAITDHDNCDGVDEFLSTPSTVRRIAGVELSIEPGDGFDKFHLLGLGVDFQNDRLKDFLRRILVGRNERNQRILENFAAIGIEIDPEEILRYAKGEVLARPHFARWLIDHGYAESTADAFEKFLLADSPVATRCYQDRWRPTQEDAFAAVHAAGGLAVMAHPRYWKSEWKRIGCDFEVAEKGFAALKEMGLDGVESIYQANTPEENIVFTRLADKFGFLKTAGSDFHGANKPQVTLGMNVPESFIAPVLERLSILSR